MMAPTVQFGTCLGAQLAILQRCWSDASYFSSASSPSEDSSPVVEPRSPAAGSVPGIA